MPKAVTMDSHSSVIIGSDRKTPTAPTPERFQVPGLRGKHRYFVVIIDKKSTQASKVCFGATQSRGIALNKVGYSHQTTELSWATGDHCR
jgi:hypothetical protein